METSLKVYFIGYGGNSWMAEDLRPVIEETGMTLCTIHEHQDADIKWERHTWLSHLCKADIIIAPANYKNQPAKSANRLIQGMSLGKPVICSPLPAYMDVSKKYPGSFLIADTPVEWKECLRLLKNNPSFREQLGKRALEAVQDYSIDSIGKKWLKLLKENKPSPSFVKSGDLIDAVIDPVKKKWLEPLKESVRPPSLVKSGDLTDIVIPTYKNLSGLKLCLDSIIACTTVPYKIIVVNNGEDEELHKYCQQRNDIVYVKKERLNFSQAINTGIKAGNSKYVMLLNDDVIVSKGWLKSLIDECTDKIGAVGPLSNCDKFWLHFYDINIGGVDLLPGLNTLEQIEPIIPQIYEFKSNLSEIKGQDWIAFYATLIPRSVIDEVGLLDESFTNSGEDVDYCNRIRKLGYKILQNYQSFVFHFGAVSRKILESEDKEAYQEADKQTQAYLKTKHSKKLLVIYSGPSWERWSYKSLEVGGIGGSEVWQINLCREFDKLGYRVVSFNDSPEQEMWEEGIQYLHFNQFPQWCEQNYADYAIFSRTTDPLRHPLRAGKIYIQLHDIWMLSDKSQLFLNKVEKFCVLSQWHLDFASDYHKIPKEKVCIMANGIDFDRFDHIKVDRNPYRLHWSSSWDRGLDNVLYLFPFIKNEIPQIELHVFYGCETWKRSCLTKKDERGLKEIAEIEKGIEQKGIFNHGRVGQEELAIAQKKASLLLYPTGFSETFYITGIECQRAGVPIITNKYAGLITTLGDSAILLGNGDSRWPYTKEGREQFLEKTVSILKNRGEWEKWSDLGIRNTERFSWRKVALMWQELFQNTGNYKEERLLAHEMGFGNDYMPNPQGHLNNERDRFHYYKVLNAFVSSNSNSAIDVGCFDGWIDFLLMEQGFKLTGVELMEPLVKAAQQFAKSKDINYRIYQGFFEDIEIDQKFDLVICLETLEHISFDLVSVYIKKMEKIATKGIFISLPDQSHEENPQHLWTPTEVLIKKMWGDKKNFFLEYHTYQDVSIPANWLIYFEV